MATKGNKKSSVTFEITTTARPNADQRLAVYLFDRRGNLIEEVPVQRGKAVLGSREDVVAQSRVVIAPLPDHEIRGDRIPTVEALERLGGFQPPLRNNDGGLITVFDIPGSIIDLWPLCFCFVHGQVLRAADNRTVCGARVHVCEVDRIPWWILRLPDLDLVRLRDDLLEVLERPPLVDPPTAPVDVSIFRVDEPQLPVIDRDRIVTPASETSASLMRSLRTPSVPTLRTLLAENWRIIYPWFCVWPWWWNRFRCDEITTMTTDANGRFSTVIGYQCAGDKPDLYFWIEYDFGSGFETVYRPPIGCNTYWDYDCGSEVTLRVHDDRVPGCSDEPPLPGCQVVVNSIGNQVSVNEVIANAPVASHDGLIQNSVPASAGSPFGGTLEFRVDFSSTALIDDKKIPYYRWSYRRRTGPDGVTNVVAPTSEPIGTWKIMTQSVHRHYRDGTSYPADLLGPMPVGASPLAPIENLFRIKPASPPNGSEWVSLDQHVDLATAYFATGSLMGATSGEPSTNPPAPAADDLAAGQYEVKLELFDSLGNLVNWTAEGIELNLPDQPAPFGSGTITTSPAPSHNRVLNGSDTMGFRMVIRVDNNHCFAQIMPVGGSVVPDPVCGFHEYSSLSDSAQLAFVARHPHGFASYRFSTVRGVGTGVPDASTSGIPGSADGNGFANAGFSYQKMIPVSTLLGACPSAAFAEHLSVEPLAQNGYSVLSHLRHSDMAAFALAAPCPPCDADQD